MRIFAIPHAGRGASLFYPWHAMLPPWIEMIAVQLPGREERLREPGLSRLDPMVGALAAEIAPRLDRPYALLGHSMGALICYELARAVHGHAPPAALILSGRQPPDFADRLPPLHQLPDSAFIETLQARFDGIPRAVLDQPDLLALVLPTLRCDIEAVETYRFRPGPPLCAPFFVYGGQDDRLAPLDSLSGWRAFTTGPTTPRSFPGGHFYLQERPGPVIDALVRDLGPLVTN